jgi:hypothetical protein
MEGATFFAFSLLAASDRLYLSGVWASAACIPVKAALSANTRIATNRER